MGNCTASLVNTIDALQRVENVAMRSVRREGELTVEVERTDAYLTRRSVSTKDMDVATRISHFQRRGSLAKWLREACNTHGDKRAVGYRKIVKTTKEKILDAKGKEKDWEFVHLGATQYLSYKQLQATINHIAFGLRALGVHKGHTVALYEETRWEWMAACHGIWTAGAIGVTVYANLGMDALLYALKESEVETIICSAKGAKNLFELCKEAGVKLRRFIILDGPLGGDANAPAGAEIVSWERLLELGEAEAKGTLMPIEAEAQDSALIMYTSGTTGDPKGVDLTHGNIVAVVEGFSPRLKAAMTLGGESFDDEPSYLAYLPLAHILEFAAESVFFVSGFLVGYGGPRTLTDMTARPHGDLAEFKPVIFAGVPRVFDTLMKTAEGKLPPVGTIKRAVFDRAFQERRDALRRGLDTPFYTRKIFDKPAQLLGGRCKFIVSGGAPLSAVTQEWLMVVFGAYCGQGYGLTETGTNATLQQYGHYKMESGGKIVSTVELRLRSVEDFKITDTPFPRGEVMIRGATVAKGYYKQPGKTAEAFSEDGWFATGDVGSFVADGSLSIVGRVKALAKNLLGEYIALEALEATYVQNPLVLPNGICVCVDPQQAFIVAIALTDEQKAMAFCAQKNIQGAWPAVLQSKEFQKAAIASMAETAKANKRKPFEYLKNVRFYADEWTPENGIMTAAMKLKRREIDAKYGNDIAELFKAVA